MYKGVKKYPKTKQATKRTHCSTKFEKPEGWIDLKRTPWQKFNDSDSETSENKEIEETQETSEIQENDEIYCVFVKKYVITEISYTLAQSTLIHNFLMQKNNQLDESEYQADDLYFKRLEDIKKFIDIYNKFIDSKDFKAPWRLMDYKYKCFDGRKRINRYKIFDSTISLNDLNIRNCEKDWWNWNNSLTDPLHRRQETSYMQGFFDEELNIFITIISFVTLKYENSKFNNLKQCEQCDECDKNKYLKCGEYNLQCKNCKSLGTIDDWCIKCHGEITHGAMRQIVHEKEMKLIDTHKLFERAADPQSHTLIRFFCINGKMRKNLTKAIGSLSIKY